MELVAKEQPWTDRQRATWTQCPAPQGPPVVLRSSYSRHHAEDSVDSPSLSSEGSTDCWLSGEDEGWKKANIVKGQVSSSALNLFVAIVYGSKLTENRPKNVITQSAPPGNAANQDKICTLRFYTTNHWENSTGQPFFQERQTNKRSPSLLLKVLFLHSRFSPHSVSCGLAPHPSQDWASQEFTLT